MVFEPAGTTRAERVSKGSTAGKQDFNIILHTAWIASCGFLSMHCTQKPATVTETNSNLRTPLLLGHVKRHVCSLLQAQLRVKVEQDHHHQQDLKYQADPNNLREVADLQYEIDPLVKSKPHMLMLMRIACIDIDNIQSKAKHGRLSCNKSSDRVLHAPKPCTSQKPSNSMRAPCGLNSRSICMHACMH